MGRVEKWRVWIALAAGLVSGWLAATGCVSSKPEPNYDLIAQAWNIIENKYVERTSVNSAELTYGAINGMVDALGDTGHSTFLTPAMVEQMKIMEHGRFRGIGIEIGMRDDHVVVIAPLDDSPAQRAGLRPGDRIIKVSDQDVTGWSLNQVVQRITGPPGSKVKLTIEDPHTQNTRMVTIVRATIKVHDITWQRLPGTSIAHLRIASFDHGAAKDLRRVLAEMPVSAMDGIILDLRNNPGGLLNEAVEVASQFLKDGNVLLIKDAKGRSEPVRVLRGGLATEVPLVVLINSGSASAAEIVAGALQAAHRASLVGETTFGTGTVLGEFHLADGSALLLAIEEWLTPDGRSFWHKGIKPEVAVSLPHDVTPLSPGAERGMDPAQLEASKDRQLLQALAELRQQTAARASL
jgi:carboxyl-terminal processing protease